MIEFKTGDIFKQKVGALVCPVNCVGVMGNGLAKEFKERFPHYFEVYNAACRIGKIKPGVLQMYDNLSNPEWIISFPTKHHWQDDSKLEYIAAGISALVSAVVDRRIQSIAIPALGCGKGNLEWADVKPIIERGLENVIGCRIIVLKPHGKGKFD